MRLIPFCGILCLCLLLAPMFAPAQTSGGSAGAGPTAAPGDRQELTGAAAWEKLIGNTSVGTVDGRAFAEYYARDGVVKFRIDGKVSLGRWQVEDESVCFEYPGDPRECLRPTLSEGRNITWTDGKGTVDSRGTLMPGNAENL